MKSVEVKGRTVEEAIDEALKLLGVPREWVEVEVLDVPSRGILGLARKDARVRVTVQRSRADLAREFIEGIVRRMGVDAAVEVRRAGGALHVDVVGKDVGFLIGKRGQTLQALEYLLKIATAGSEGGDEQLVLDVGGYRRRRERQLEDLANRAARQVMRTGKPVMLEPMDARSRRTIHLALQRHPGVSTHSEGEEPNRRVIVSPKT
ncbi:MAG TPA: protein jag [Firmicutes bacterium]|nr:protein jag [Candidatus Fermentithermobacillaceae bacterium]